MMPVTAHGKLGEHEIEAEVLNPGDWFGKAWLIEVGCGYSSVYYVVEADNPGTALDEFADSKAGHHIHIGEADAEDYADEFQSGDLVGGLTNGDPEIKERCWITINGTIITDPEKGKYLSPPDRYGNAGTPCDTTDVLVHGQDGTDLPWTCTYHDPNDDTFDSVEGIDPRKYPYRDEQDEEE